MLKRTFDRIPIFAGLVIAAVMIVAGVLLTLGQSFVNNQVGKELAAQKITLPSSQQIATLPAADAAVMSKYAGEFMTTGPQADAYADHYLSVQIRRIGRGQSYTQLLAEVATIPRSQIAQIKHVQQKIALVFRDQIMQGELLNSYGYWKIGQIMLIAAFVAFAGAAVLLLASIAGLARLRRTAAEAPTQPKLGPEPA